MSLSVPLGFGARSRRRGIAFLGALLVLALMAVVLPLRAADPPHLIPFQGHLARPAAGDPAKFEPVPAGRFDVLFTLYASPVGGESKVWGPERHSQLTVVNGLVNAMLGSVIGFDAALATDPNLFAGPLYVGITVDADGNPATSDLELLPRQVLVPSVYAMNANKLDGYDWHDAFANGNPTTTILSSRIANASITGQKLAPQTITTNLLAPTTVASLVPPGTISAFGGPTSKIPSGWLLCDGAAVKTNAYPNLFAVIGTTWGAGTASADDFSLPDLRSRFLLGAGQGPGLALRTLGDMGGEENHVLSENEMPRHNHTWGKGFTGDDQGSGGGAREFADVSGSDTTVIGYAGSSWAHNTMPPFRGVNYIIKY